jgi:hypothetical protein
MLRKEIPDIKILPFAMEDMTWGDVETNKGTAGNEIIEIIEGWLA